MGKLERCVRVPIMGIAQFSRNVNLLKTLTVSDFNGAAASKTIYQAEDSGFPEAIARDIIATEFTLVSLRLNVFISSIAPAEVVIPQALDSDTAILVKNKANDLRFPRFLLNLYLAGAETVQIGGLFLHNRQPYYVFNLMPYFSSAASFPLQHGTAIVAEVTDAGYGVFQGSDKITFVGAVQETCYLREWHEFIPST